MALRRTRPGRHGRRTKGGPRTGDNETGNNETGDDETDEDGRPIPRGAVRLRLASPTHIGDLSGPTTCALQHPAEKQAATAEIGPDPLRPGARPARAWAVISKSKQPIGQLPMRQEIIGGIGNIYRAELLFRARIDPFRPGRALALARARAQFDALWHDARALLRDGVRDGVIITTRPKDRPVKTPVVGRRMRRDARSYVAFRNGEPCPICQTG